MPGRRSGFTLIEIMIVVSIIALLAVIAVPSFLRARQRAQNTKFINALRVASGAFDTYAMEHNSYPPDVFRGIVPPGMAPTSAQNLVGPRRLRSEGNGIGIRTSLVSKRASRL